MNQPKTKARAIAFYLPQFHPIPENDEWWGKGFTEWTNVTKAKPLFSGHYQPHLPADLGFYDLRVPEVREAQAAMAKEYGIEGFCYWHYWFGNGKQILERVFNEVLESGKPDFPFCLAWANATWSGIWHGMDSKILIEQTYPSVDDFKEHFIFLNRAFHDKRYITINGKPLFVVYRPEELPEPENVLSLWRRMSKENGFPDLYIAGIFCNDNEPSLKLYDAAMPSEPGYTLARIHTPFFKKIQNKIINKVFVKINSKPTVLKYDKYSEYWVKKSNISPFNVPCILPNWDNTPRSSIRGLVFNASTPNKFSELFRWSLSVIHSRPIEERIIFIKSWNEWAEGNYLEPDNKFGKSYLKAIQDEIY